MVKMMSVFQTITAGLTANPLLPALSSSPLWMVDHHPLTFTFSPTSLAHTYFILISVMTSLKGKGCEVWRCIQSQLFKSTLPVTCPDIRSAESLQLVSDPGPAGFK